MSLSEPAGWLLTEWGPSITAADVFRRMLVEWVEAVKEHTGRSPKARLKAVSAVEAASGLSDLPAAAGYGQAGRWADYREDHRAVADAVERLGSVIREAAKEAHRGRFSAESIEAEAAEVYRRTDESERRAGKSPKQAARIAKDERKAFLARMLKVADLDKPLDLAVVDKVAAAIDRVKRALDDPDRRPGYLGLILDPGRRRLGREDSPKTVDFGEAPLAWAILGKLMANGDRRTPAAELKELWVGHGRNQEPDRSHIDNEIGYLNEKLKALSVSAKADRKQRGEGWKLTPADGDPGSVSE